MPPSESFEKAQTLRKVGKYQAALKLLDNCIAGLPPDARSERIELYNEQSQCLWRTGMLTDAEDAAERARRLADEFPPDLRGKGMALANLGYAFAEKDELGEAEKYFEESLRVFEQIGTLQEIADILKPLEIINRSRQQPEKAEDYQERLEILQEQIEREISQKSSETSVPIDPSRLFLMCIRMMGLGPEVYLSQELPFEKKKVDEFFLKVGIYYTTALGQGGSFHQGLYGPLPLTANYSSLVYSRVLPDRTQTDPRMPGKTYAILCVGYPRDQEGIFADRKTLTKVFEEHTSKIGDISEINLEFLDFLRGSLF
ncbi:MAG: tetratricopeptide repeat protein [Candidatus Hodarchaeales archaeon]|jgi:tetratricopeptide (TPR) repeat protein